VTTWINSIPISSVPSSELLAELRALEGERVDLTLRDGSQLEDCDLISIGRLWAKSIWVLREDADLVISVVDILSVRPASAPPQLWP
jgi:hypothetical protein